MHDAEEKPWTETPPTMLLMHTVPSSRAWMLVHFRDARAEKK